jgi:NAD(P)-dependent dehydrogenase (short-subunit alcohol dehydrogenase family)
MPTRWALITGTSTGIGRAAALRLVKEGVSVLAGVRKAADGEKLVAEATAAARGASAPGKLVPVLLDVADRSSLQRATEAVKSIVGADGLWALVNNAGIVVPGPVEHVSDAEWRRQFDVNFFGVIELTRVMLPLLRDGVRAHGAYVPRLLIVSSIGGRVAQPINAPYTSSKWAVTALGDSLRIELRRQSIGVTVLEPGAIATAIWKKGDDSATMFGPGHPAREFYGPEIDGLSSWPHARPPKQSPPTRRLTFCGDP